MNQHRVARGTNRDRPGAGRGWIRRLVLTAALMLATIPLLAGPVAPAHAATDTVTDCSGPVGAGRLVTVVGAAAAGDTVIFACSGTITLTSTLALSQDVTIDGSGQAVTISGGGTVQVLSMAPGVAVSLNNLTISNGNAGSAGGGIINSGTLTVTNSTLSGNTAFPTGGGIENDGTLTVANSTFNSNSAPGGGAIYNQGTLTVTNSTISGNNSSVKGGALNNNAGIATLTNDTISGNSAGVPGGAGGIYNNAVVAVTNSIVAQNTNGDCGGNPVSNGGGNLDSDASCGFGAGHTAASPGLGALANFGGPTQTMPLLLGSPALGLGNPAVCAAAPVNSLDQRRIPRSSPTVCDSGAYQTLPLSLAPPGAPSTITPYVFADGMFGIFFSASTLANGGSGSYNYTISSGAAPPGVTLAGPIGLLFGIIGPVSGGYPHTFTFTVTALDTTNPQIGRQSYSITVDPAPTTTMLIANPGTPTFGQATTLTASVLGGMAGIPTGAVSFHDGSAGGPVISCTGGSQVLDAGGIATCQTSTLSVGPHTVFAVYGGDGNFTGSTSNGAPVTVSPGLPPAPPAPPPAQTPIISWGAPAPITYGTALEGTELNAVATINGSPVGGTITYSPPAGTVLHAGANQPLVASFTPLGGNVTGATGVVNITVNPAPSTLALVVDPTSATAGQAVTLIATATSSAVGAGLPTGVVTFYDGGDALGVPVPLDAGTATLTTSLPAGGHALSAVYTPSMNALGAADFIGSQAAASLAVGQASTTIRLTSVHSTGNIGQGQIFTVKVRGPGTNTPTGMVSFYDTSEGTRTLLGTAPLDRTGTAGFTDSGLAVGMHPMLAVYEGDSQFAGSQSAIVTQNVRSCSVTALLKRSGSPVLNLLTTATAKSKAQFQFRVGRTMVSVTNFTVTYCAEPGRPDAQAVVTGTVTTKAGQFAKGDQISLGLRARTSAHATETLEAMLVDQTTRRRLTLGGPFDKGSVIRITTP